VRRLALAGLAAMVMVAPACKRQPRPHVAELPASATVASVVKMNDPDAAAQLLSGFYAVEDNSWRWVARSFSVVLRPPAGAAQNGARLSLKFNVPAGLVKHGPVTVGASAGGQALAPENYGDAGNHTYVRELPAGAVGKDVVVNFICDKTLPPANGDVRELALIVVSVGLEGK
jgi:hypothetical protein